MRAARKLGRALWSGGSASCGAGADHGSQAWSRPYLRSTARARQLWINCAWSKRDLSRHRFVDYVTVKSLAGPSLKKENWIISKVNYQSRRIAADMPLLSNGW
jgi:hypothetical protein